MKPQLFLDDEVTFVTIAQSGEYVLQRAWLGLDVEPLPRVPGFTALFDTEDGAVKRFNDARPQYSVWHEQQFSCSEAGEQRVRELIQELRIDELSLFAIFATRKIRK